MPPIPVTELQYLAILNAANALCASDRDQFVAAVYAELHGKPVGDGAIGRAIRMVQVSFPHPTPPERPSGGRLWRAETGWRNDFLLHHRVRPDRGRVEWRLIARSMSSTMTQASTRTSCAPCRIN